MKIDKAPRGWHVCIGTFTVLAIFYCGQARAQFSVVPLKMRGSETVPNLGTADLAQGKYSIRRTDCESDSILAIQVNNIPVGKASIALWNAGPKGGSNCHKKADRTNISAPCQEVQVGGIAPIPVGSVGGQLQNFDKLGVRTLFGLDCSKDYNNTQVSVFLLAVSDANYEDVTDFVQLKYPIDFVPPAASTQLEGGTGFGEVPVTWAALDGETSTTLEGYRIYADPTSFQDVTDGPDCDYAKATTLREGGDFTDDKDLILLGTVKGVTNRTSLNLSGKIPLGKRAVIAVVAEDLSGNLGKFSKLGCIAAVQSQGFKSSLGSDFSTGVGCQVAPSRGVSSAASAGLFAVVFSLRLRRRKRSGQARKLSMRALGPRSVGLGRPRAKRIQEPS